MSVTVLVQNSCYTTGEGPHWDEASQSLLYVDILAGDVHRHNTDTGANETIHVSDSSVSLVVPRVGGGCVVGVGRTLGLLDLQEGRVVKTYGEVDSGTQNRFNDGKCDPSGRLWAGTMGHEPVPSQVDRHMGALYTLGTDGAIKRHLSEIDISNGLAWSEDSRTMFYIDSFPRKVYAFDFDINEGTISNQRTCVDFGEGTVDSMGFPDGMCMDAEGKMWVACYNGSKVIRFDPETAKQLQTIEFPAKRITSCCFGGRNLDELYVTSGKFGLTDAEFKDEQPMAGSLFKVTGLGVKGMPVKSYEGA